MLLIMPEFICNDQTPWKPLNNKWMSSLTYTLQFSELAATPWLNNWVDKDHILKLWESCLQSEIAKEKHAK